MKTPSQHLDRVIKEFSRLPGIGHKSASRLAFHILQMSDDQVSNFTDSILKLKENIFTCQTCGGISDNDVCHICSDHTRNGTIICVVEEQKDILTIEKSAAFNGTYHVLNGVISPLDGIGPEDLNIASLIEKCNQGNVKELILATNPTVEGDATCLYISKLIKPSGIKIMRIARGLPVGADLEFTDSVTIAKSFNDRVEI